MKNKQLLIVGAVSLVILFIIFSRSSSGYFIYEGPKEPLSRKKTSK